MCGCVAPEAQNEPLCVFTSALLRRQSSLAFAAFAPLPGAWTGHAGCLKLDLRMLLKQIHAQTFSPSLADTLTHILRPCACLKLP